MEYFLSFFLLPMRRSVSVNATQDGVVLFPCVCMCVCVCECVCVCVRVRSWTERSASSIMRSASRASGANSSAASDSNSAALRGGASAFATAAAYTDASVPRHLRVRA